MDPATILQLVGTAMSISDVVFRCIKDLSALKAKYRDAPLLLSTLIGQLYIVQTALDKLSAWKSQDFKRDPRYDHLELQMDHSLDAFSPLIFALQQQLSKHDKTETTAKGKLSLLWNEREMLNYSSLLDRQVNALNLLVEAMQCTTWEEQRNVIGCDENQSTIRLAKDCSSSMMGQHETASYASENSEAISTLFEFDDILLDSTLYRQAQRSHLRQALRATRYRAAQPTITEVPSAKNAVDTSCLNVERNDRVRKTAVTAQPAIHGTAEDVSATVSATVSAKGVMVHTEITTYTHSVAAGTNQRPPFASHQFEMAPAKHKVLLLGDSESGKSTLTKALNLAAGGGYTRGERLLIRDIILTNVAESAKVVLTAMTTLEIPLEYQSNECHAREILRLPRYMDDHLLLRTSQAIVSLWSDRGFREGYRRRNMCQRGHPFGLLTDEYVPTDEDILRSRVKSCGISSTSIVYKNHEYEILDAGGARSQRKKWMRAADLEISTILFMVDTMAYPSRLFNDMAENRMSEQLLLFNSTVNWPAFTDKNFALVFSKMDLLETCLSGNNNLRNFPDVCGADTHPGILDRYLQYLEDEFLSLCHSVEQRNRIRIIRGDLVAPELNTAKDVFEVLVQYDRQA
ncbi:G-protein alpha subunit-domain-containing protein [Hypoxylon sp. FL1284]|nr:G-protein alpha subunit-domain-containing protein [Hypoxylon sp. FL1284]